LPIAWDTSAASSAASKNSLRPNEPPPEMTCTLTWSGVMPSFWAICSCATIGDFRPAQISAEPDRTSATAQLGSRAELLRKWNVNAASRVFASGSTFGTASGISAAFSSLSTEASSAPGTEPSFQSTRSARTASMHWPNVRARTATPVETFATWVTPGIASTSARLRIRFGVPLSRGARQIIAGSAPGTCRSSANFLRPVTASSASVRPCGFPITSKSADALSVTSTCRVVVEAALRARSA
jgi:hypothetical protein